MDITTFTGLVTNVGFPIICVAAMAWFIYEIFTKTTAQNEENMQKVQERCAAREDKLYEEIKENREINAKAIATIAQYAEKLDTIQTDIDTIKTDITVIMTKK